MYRRGGGRVLTTRALTPGISSGHCPDAFNGNNLGLWVVAAGGLNREQPVGTRRSGPKNSSTVTKRCMPKSPLLLIMSLVLCCHCDKNHASPAKHDAPSGTLSAGSASTASAVPSSAPSAELFVSAVIEPERADRFLKTLVGLLEQGDAKAISGLVAYPLYVDRKPAVETPMEFVARYSELFSPAVKRDIERATPSNLLFTGSVYAFGTPSGYLWFDDVETDDGTMTLKIIAMNTSPYPQPYAPGDGVH